MARAPEFARIRTAGDPAASGPHRPRVPITAGWRDGPFPRPRSEGSPTPVGTPASPLVEPQQRSGGDRPQAGGSCTVAARSVGPDVFKPRGDLSPVWWD